MSNNATDIVPLLVVAIAIVAIALVNWRRPRTTAQESFVQGSALLAYYTKGNAPRTVDDISVFTPIYSLKEGELGDGSYYNIISVAADRLIYTVQLTFQTELHALAIARVSAIDEMALPAVGTAMQKVDLEGDFPDYFHLYVTPGQEGQVRYILDPEAMGNVMEFCRTNSWELLNDELYIVVTSQSEQIVALRAIEEFLAQIRPVIATKSTAPEHKYRMGKNQAIAQLKATCPVCGAQLIRRTDWRECPKGHGYLLTGEELAKMRRKQLAIMDEDVPDTSVPHEVIMCPACGHPMTPIPYVNGHTIIDSCMNCHYRWLDGGEQSQIASE